MYSHGGHHSKNPTLLGLQPHSSITHSYSLSEHVVYIVLLNNAQFPYSVKPQLRQW